MERCKKIFWTRPVFPPIPDEEKELIRTLLFHYHSEVESQVPIFFRDLYKHTSEADQKFYDQMRQKYSEDAIMEYCVEISIETCRDVCRKKRFHDLLNQILVIDNQFCKKDVIEIKLSTFRHMFNGTCSVKQIKHQELKELLDQLKLDDQAIFRKKIVKGTRFYEFSYSKLSKYLEIISSAGCLKLPIFREKNRKTIKMCNTKSLTMFKQINLN